MVYDFGKNIRKGVYVFNPKNFEKSKYAFECVCGTILNKKVFKLSLIGNVNILKILYAKEI